MAKPLDPRVVNSTTLRNINIQFNISSSRFRQDPKFVSIMSIEYDTYLQDGTFVKPILLNSTIHEGIERLSDDKLVGLIKSGVIEDVMKRHIKEITDNDVIITPKPVESTPEDPVEEEPDQPEPVNP